MAAYGPLTYQDTIEVTLCRHFLKHHCKFGNKCRKLHLVLDRGICRYNVFGKCNTHVDDCINDHGVVTKFTNLFGKFIRYNCQYYHGNECHRCKLRVMHPYDSDSRLEHEENCKKESIRLETIEKHRDVECVVCFEKVLEKQSDNRFGLLSGCEHPICLGCVRKWRDQQLPNSDCCPYCREPFEFVIPSNEWIADSEEKKAQLTIYKASLKTIPCRFGEECDYGEHYCYYKH